MKMLMLTLPFMVRDLSAQEVYYADLRFMACIHRITFVNPSQQVTLVNAAIDGGKSGSLFHCLPQSPHISEPSYDIQVV